MSLANMDDDIHQAPGDRCLSSRKSSRTPQDFARRHLQPSQRKTIAISRVKFNYQTYTWESGKFELPYYNSDHVILTPKDILTKDDTWINKSDLVREFDDIADSIPNEQLRAQINYYFRRALPEEPKREHIQVAVAHVIAEYPQFLDYYIRYKEDHGEEAVALSKERVKEIETLFIQQLSEFVIRLHKESNFYATEANTYEETRAKVLFLKDVIENKGGHKLFYAKGAPIRRESDLQILFRLTWFATPSDISREVNDGRGPVDFKVSRGNFDKSLVEFKLATNSHLRRNLERQTAIYEKASDAQQSLRVILYFSDRELAQVQKILKELDLEGRPDVILIDARESNKPSGSKA